MLKKYLIGSMVIAAFAFAFVVSAADFGSTTLKVGSKGEAVKAVQTLVGATADGSFGPMTKAKVQVWQAANGLTADGLFGNASKAKANATVTTTTTTTTTTVAGCPAGALFNSLTGAACTTTTGTTTVSTTGQAGDLTITNSTAGLETEIKEGDVNTPVLSFKAQATGSDINVSSVKVELTNTDTSGTSTRLERYASEVSVYMGSTKVGSALVSDFSKTGIVYSKSIALTGAVVKPGLSNKATFWVEVTALPSIDSADIATDDWTMKVASTRWADGTGMVLSDTTAIAKTGTDAATGVSFSSLASGDLKLTISKGAMPAAANVKASTTTTTDTLMNEFKLKATGSKMTVNSISLALSTPTGDTLASATNEVNIKVNGTQIATNDATLVDDATYLFTLDDPMDIAAGSTVTFDVYAKVNKIAGGFAAGDSLKVDYATSNVEDANGDAIPGGNRTGTAVGETQSFYADGLNLTLISTSAVKSLSTAPASTPDSGTYTIKFKATNFGDTDLYVDKSTLDNTASATVAGQGVGYRVYKNGAVSSAAAATYATAAGIVSASGSTTNDSAFGFLVSANSSRDITLTVSFPLAIGGATDSDGFYSVGLQSVNWGALTTDLNANFYSANLGDFKTDELTLSDYAL